MGWKLTISQLVLQGQSQPINLPTIWPDLASILKYSFNYVLALSANYIVSCKHPRQLFNNFVQVCITRVHARGGGEHINMTLKPLTSSISYSANVHIQKYPLKNLGMIVMPDHRHTCTSRLNHDHYDIYCERYLQLHPCPRS